MKQNDYNKFLKRVEASYANYPMLTISHVVTVYIDTKDMSIDDLEYYTEFMYRMFWYCHDGGLRLIGIHEVIPGEDKVYIGIDIVEEANFEHFCRSLLTENGI